MARAFRASDNKVAIWDGYPDFAPFNNPLGNLNRVKFHTDLDYLKVIDVKSYVLALPAIGPGGSGQGSGGSAGLRTASYALGPHGRPGQPFCIGVITVKGVPIAFTGSVPVQTAADEGFGRDSFARFVSLGVDGSSIIAYEYSVQLGEVSPANSWVRRSAINLPITVYITDVLL